MDERRSDPALPAVLYVWKAPRPNDPAGAEALLDELPEGWATGGLEPGAPFGLPAIDFVPFEASDDVGWFYRELTGDTPPLWNPDAPPKNGPPPNLLVVVPIHPESVRETLEEVYSLALKYDLLVYDPQRRDLREPTAEASAYASATFWPRGAIQAATAGAAGAVIAVIAWFVGIPIVSGIAVVIGAFLFAMSVLTFVAEGRKRMRKEQGASTNPRA